MNTPKLIEEMQSIQSKLLDFLDNETDEEQNFQILKQELDNIKVCDDMHKFKLFLYLISKISNNHHRGNNFFNKIDRILRLFKDDIKKYFTNQTIFNIFKGNKRILLFLIDEKIMIMDESIAKIIVKNQFLSAKYPQYFAPEIKQFVNKDWFPTKRKKEKIQVTKTVVKKLTMMMMKLNREVMKVEMII